MRGCVGREHPCARQGTTHESSKTELRSAMCAEGRIGSPPHICRVGGREFKRRPAWHTRYHPDSRPGLRPAQALGPSTPTTQLAGEKAARVLTAQSLRFTEERP